jgi:hypothetical protein
MMPFYETRVEKELISEGRIRGGPGYRDYDFLEDSMNGYFEFISGCFMEWTRDREGVLNISKWARNYLSVCSRFFEMETALTILSGDLKKIISESNIFFIERMRELALLFESGTDGSDHVAGLAAARKRIRNSHAKYRKRINDCIFTLITLSELHKNAIRHSCLPAD